VTTSPATSTVTSDVLGGEVVGSPPKTGRVVVVVRGSVVGGEVLPVGNGRDVVVGRTVVLVGKRVVVGPVVVVITIVVVGAPVVVVANVVVDVDVVVGAVVVEETAVVVVVGSSTTTKTADAHNGSSNPLS
jgi:hypothetical protein